MKRHIIIGFIFGALLIPVGTLGLSIFFIEALTSPLIIIPRIVVGSFLDVQHSSAFISLGVLTVTSSLLYGIIGYAFHVISSKFNSKIAGGLLVALYLLVMFSGFSQTIVPQKNEIPGASLGDRQELDLGIIGLECRTHSDCPTPISYAIRSNCPYEGVCINNTCAVVCPMWEHSLNQEENISYEVMCKNDSECNCSQWDSDKQFRCACIDGQCGSVVNE